MSEKQLIYKQVSEVMNAVGAVEKGRQNKQQGYSFRGIDDMYNALNQHLAKAKLFFVSEVVDQSREERKTQKGGTLFYTIIKMRWTVYAEDGSSVVTETVGEAMDSGDKSANKAMSAAYKYALMQIFCIPTNEVKDTEDVSHQVVPQDKLSSTETKEYTSAVIACRDLEELKVVWSKLPAVAKKELVVVKDAKKKELEVVKEDEKVDNPVDNSEVSADEIEESLPPDMGGSGESQAAKKMKEGMKNTAK